MARTEAKAGLAALYVRPASAERRPYANLHLERLLWSYNRDFATAWAVSYGWPTFDSGARAAGPRFDVAFVDEDAVPADLSALGGVKAAELLARTIVWVARVHAPAADVPIHSPAALLARPLSFDKFCTTCARVLLPPGAAASARPFGGRFEYHTFDVLQDIWSECGVPERAAPAPLDRYSLDDVLDATRAEAVVATRRTPRYTLLFANRPFFEQVGWDPSVARRRSLSFLHGPLTQRDVLESLHEALGSAELREAGGAGAWTGTLVNYTQAGRPFHNRLTVSPCTDASLFVGQIAVDDEPAAKRSRTRAEPDGARATVTAAAAAAPVDAAGAEDDVFVEALAQALLDSAANVVVTRATPPFPIVHVNDAWCALCDFQPEEVSGKTLRTIQGPRTDAAVLAASMAELVERNRPVTMRLTNYKKGGHPFTNRVTVEPICDRSGAARYFVGRLVEESDVTALPLAAVF
ncbi:hypothetical protein KFE25_008196 [Diacronema lutheri]|uniref:PAS domain-containing protein n=1 Tax=Diacronema lutheri TaxID=2081491 RepID=A0A8J5XR04_DIALT|nr:hypothetical protein KFE25_008196 [Diacronema lutheri]